jgi:hypothetical protein
MGGRSNAARWPLPPASTILLGDFALLCYGMHLTATEAGTFQALKRDTGRSQSLNGGFTGEPSVILSTSIQPDKSAGPYDPGTGLLCPRKVQGKVCRLLS